MKKLLHPAYKGIKSVYLGILANFLLAVIKALAGWWGNSYALIADAIESLSDVLTSVVVLIGLHAAARQPDAEHPYGHGKAEPIAGVFVAISLLTAAFFIARQSIENIQTPHAVPSPFTLVVLGGVIFIKGRLFSIIRKTGEEIKSTAVKGDAWHHLSDAITSLAAAVGILVAIIGGEGYESADDWAALIGCFFIAYNAISLFKPAFNELMDAAPSREIIEEVVNIAKNVEGVISIGKCTVRKMGFDYFVDIHIGVDARISVKEGHDIGHAVKDAIQRYKPMVMDVLTHVEPEEKKKNNNNKTNDA